MRQQQREYYQSVDKAIHAARVREYRRKNHDAYLAYRRENLCRENDLQLCHIDHDIFDA